MKYAERGVSTTSLTKLGSAVKVKFARSSRSSCVLRGPDEATDPDQARTFSPRESACLEAGLAGRETPQVLTSAYQGGLTVPAARRTCPGRMRTATCPGTASRSTSASSTAPRTGPPAASSRPRTISTCSSPACCVASCWAKPSCGRCSPRSTLVDVAREIARRHLFKPMSGCLHQLSERSVADR